MIEGAGHGAGLEVDRLDDLRADARRFESRDGGLRGRSADREAAREEDTFAAARLTCLALGALLQKLA